ncbi:uncharacterized protein GGS22DRAFT_110962 [Annulohypoxylon maeteangense]|uniref:uncharacterized protein n=1 Tax=Annulohypoxylon maeteangense TaxID=1927788 RepID=UPI00200854EF|nr:uncharacterized protein GGS22DRAFT_110962 [Annulohypoxylon maeteangense]KAI0887541.1 hypothetical protein GGS22DRAFT_110962 [Annulohypoxylon maeteangense]
MAKSNNSKPNTPKQSTPKQHATDFEKIIHAGRERKANEDLAARIFKRDSSRRASAPSGGSLASRVGVKKRQSLTSHIPAGNVNNEWTHDLHNARGRGARVQKDPNSLASRIRAPGTPISRTQTTPRRTPKRTALLRNALERATSSPTADQQINWQRTPTGPSRQGMKIKGSAGPFVVMAQNFAPGTTAADIENVMTPVGGLISNCRILKTHPLIIAEITFESKEGALQVIQQFNNQTADGKTLHVYMKPGDSFTPTHTPPTGPRAQRDQRDHETRQGGNVVVDGRMGFNDLMDTDDQDASYSNGGLYSDKMVPKATGGNDGRRGRGFRTGR